MPDNLNWIIGAAVILLIAVVWIFLKKKSGPSIPDALRPGKSLPDFMATDEQGNPVCGELLLKPRQASDIGLGSNYASGRNAYVRLLMVSSRFVRSVCRRSMHNGSAGRCRIA